jgi:hypothetical protein
MRKRNYGYILLSLLVLTGLGSQVYNPTITSKERSTVFTELKDSKKEILAEVEDLSNKQLNFRAGKEKLSIADCMNQLVMNEKTGWTAAMHALQAPPCYGDNKNTVLSDEELQQQVPVKYSVSAKKRSAREVVSEFKSERKKMLKYIQTTTQDMRHHLYQDGKVNMDSYQVVLLTALRSRYWLNEIRKIKRSRNFPK